MHDAWFIASFTFTSVLLGTFLFRKLIPNQSVSRISFRRRNDSGITDCKSTSLFFFQSNMKEWVTPKTHLRWILGLKYGMTKNGVITTPFRAIPDYNPNNSQIYLKWGLFTLEVYSSQGRFIAESIHRGVNLSMGRFIARLINGRINLS
jgi:hypothetical protein